MVSNLNENCSESEQKAFEKWLLLSEENKMMYEDYRKVWENTSVDNESYVVDINKAWNNFKLIANFEEEVPIEHSNSFRKKGIVFYALPIAALLVLSLGIYFLFINDRSVDVIKYSSAIELPQTPLILPDGSKVTVKNKVEMEYPERFSSNVRNLIFKGEAFFEVESNPEKPMIIATDNIRVKVLGTAFNLSNCSDSDEITLYLESGKVLFYSVDEIDGTIIEQISLNQGQMGVYNKTTALISKHEITDNNHIAWKTGNLEFVNAPLIDVFKWLEDNYNIRIEYTSSIVDNNLTARFNNETIESILGSLHLIYGFEYEIKGDVVIIY